MPWDAAALAATLWLASTTAGPAPQTPTAAVTPPSVAQEPSFADIVRRAATLKAETQAYENAPLGRSLASAKDFDSFETRIGQLSALDMQGHVVLASRGYSDDLKCILKGISQDLPVKLKALETAADPKARHAALEDMFYLLRDNVEVITAPPQPSA
jgi:hypothetical protein